MRQLVFASVPAGFAPGRSGYCTAARSPGLRDRLVRELELAGAHEAGEGEAYAFRLVRFAGGTFAVITRYGDTGPDYTGRASTIAHHLVFEAAEIAALPPPADIARRFAGWCEKWEGPARALPDSGSPELLGPAATLPAANWKRLAGDAGKAALFTDDSGRAVAGKIPAGPTSADTLALLAELSLVSEDKGWTTPFTTRHREPDTWATWRVSPDVSLAALPDPGRAPRATFARAGATAAAIPGFATAGKVRVNRATGDAQQHDTYRVVAHFSRLQIMTAGGFAVIVIAGATWLFMRGDDTPSPETSAPVVAKSVAPAKPVPPEVAEALAALDAEDWRRAAAAWQKLKTEHPEIAAARASTILVPLRERLVPATLKTVASALDRADDLLPEPARSKLRSTLDTMSGLARELDATMSPANTAKLAGIRAVLALMDRVDKTIPFCTIAGSTWSVETTDAGRSASADLGEAPALREFLTISRKEIAVTVSPFDGFDRQTTGETFRVSGKDFSPGRALVVRDAQNLPVLTLLFDTAGRLRITRRIADGAAAPRGAIAVRLGAGTGSERHTLVVFDGKTGPEPLALPRSLLVAKDDVVRPVAWLAKTLDTRLHGVRSPALLPSGYNGDPRQYPGLSADRAVLLQAIAARSATLSPGGDPVAAGAPWSVVVVPAGTPTPRHLIEFTAP